MAHLYSDEGTKHKNGNFSTKNDSFQKNDLRTTVDICDMTLVKWPMMSFGNVKDIFKVLIWFVMYFFCYSPTDFFCIFCRSCCLLHFYQLTEKCVTSGSKGGAIIKFQFQISFPRKDFRLPLFDPYLWSLTMVPLCTTYCTLVFMDVREEKGWLSLYSSTW